MRPSFRLTAVFLAIATATIAGVHAGAQNTARPSSGKPAAAAGASGHQHGHDGQVMRDCAAECAKCQEICDSCAAHCLKMLGEGKKAHAETLQTCLDCAEICAAADRVVARSGPFSNIICRACADACLHCAEACERFPDDQHMADCARECRKCASVCQQMLGAGTRAAQGKPQQNQSR